MVGSDTMLCTTVAGVALKRSSSITIFLKEDSACCSYPSKVLSGCLISSLDELIG